MSLSFNNKEYKTLFLDRDGVINVKPGNSYVTKLQDFIFINGALEAINKLSNYFDLIIVVTNQRGVGKKLMTEKKLLEIHLNMLTKISTYGGKIDKIYYCCDLDYSSFDLKPNVGMAHRAKNDFPNINFSNSLIIGDSASDIEFGNKLGMNTIGISNELFSNQSGEIIPCDAYYSTLLDASIAIESIFIKN